MIELASNVTRGRQQVTRSGRLEPGSLAWVSQSSAAMTSLQMIERRIAALGTVEWLGIGLTLLVGIGLIMAARRGLPRLAARLSGSTGTPAPVTSDELTRTTTPAPEKQSGAASVVARVLVWFVTLLVLAAMGLALAMSVSADPSLAVALFGGWGTAAVAWLAPHLVRLGLLALITWLSLRTAAVAIPRAMQSYLNHRASRARRADPEATKRNQTLASVAVTVVSWTIVVISSIVAFSELGFDIGPVLAGAGVLGLAIGFGAQHLVRDFFAGIYILIEDQYRIGDVVEIAGKSGVVEELSLRRTVLRDLDYVVHVVPNGEIKTASNFTKGVSRVNLDVPVAYKEDLDRCIGVINRVGQEMFDEGFGDNAMREPIKVLRVNSFDDSSIGIKVLGETQPMRQWDVAGEFRRRIKRAFDAEGIEIPFPHMSLYFGDGQMLALAQALNRPPQADKSSNGDDNKASQGKGDEGQRSRMPPNA